jgi:hypothetical protein
MLLQMQPQIKNVAFRGFRRRGQSRQNSWPPPATSWLNTGMKYALSVAFLVALVSVRAGAQADMSGEWAVSFTSPQGPQEFTMYVQQQGPRLSGRLTSEYGEFPLRGSVDGNTFTINWSMPDGGRELAITFNGTVDGDTMTGTAKLGNSGTGQLSGTRTGQ